MIQLIKLNYSALLVLLAILVFPICNYNLFFYYQNYSFKAETSVWCLKSSNNTSICRFKNICYDAQFRTFLFFLGSETLIKGLDHYSDLQKIQLSSIVSHNQFYANISVIDVENYAIEKQMKIESKAFLFSRFKPNNIMHSIHDDLLPMFLTLESVCLGERTCMESYTLLIHDHHPPGPFIDLYNLFSKQSPVLLNELPSDSSYVLCYREVLAGLVKDSIFYQYGFKKPHGPVTPSSLRREDILRFSSFLKSKLKINESENATGEILLISRLKNRKIINVDEVKEIISSAVNNLNMKITVKVIALDLFKNETINLIRLLSKADVLLGMHGAEMIFSLFIKHKAAVFELFPFGIQPDVVSFIKPVSELNGSNLMHFPWRNMNKNNSYSHEDEHPLFGGINHLDKITQERIRNATEVPPVECCNNPLFLYHMYQHTYVSGEFSQFFIDSISRYYAWKKTDDLNVVTKNWFYPYIVSNVSCDFRMSNRLLRINWLPPFNVNDNNNLKYSLFIVNERVKFKKEFLTDRLDIQIEIPGNGELGAKFQVWISVHDTTSKSPDLFFECF